MLLVVASRRPVKSERRKSVFGPNDGLLAILGETDILEILDEAVVQESFPFLARDDMQRAVGGIPQPSFLVLIEIGVGIMPFEPFFQLIEGFQAVDGGIVAENAVMARDDGLSVDFRNAYVVALGQFLGVVASL